MYDTGLIVHRHRTCCPPQQPVPSQKYPCNMSERQGPFERARARPPAQSSKEAVKNGLPDTILLDIFELECRGDSFPLDWRPENENPTTRSISRVCKRCHFLTLPILYRRIRLQHGHVKWQTSGRRLFRSLAQNSHLRSFCREVSIVLDGLNAAYFSEADADELVQLLRWWTFNLHEASLHGCIGDSKSIPILFQLSKIPLKRLSLSGFQGGISLSFFLNNFQYPRLRRLCLDRITWIDCRDAPQGR